MNSNVMIILLIFILFFIYCQYYASEKFGGTSWFPRSYLKYISNTMEHFVNTISGNNNDLNDGLESPNFSKFDIGNKFTSNNEVDGVYFNTIENKNGNNPQNSLLFNQSNLDNTYFGNISYNGDYAANNKDMELVSDNILYKRGGNASSGQWYNV